MNNFFEFEEKINEENGNGFCYMANASFYKNGNFADNLDDISLSNFLSNNFIKQEFSINKKEDPTNSDYKNIYSECKKKALNNNKDFFLVEDFSYNDQDSDNLYFQYNCYIPKASAKCEISNNLSSLFDPVNNVINTLFGNIDENVESNSDRMNNSINSNVLTNLNEYSNYNSETSCTKYTIDGSSITLPRKNNFVLYKTKLIDNAVLNDLTITSYEEYTNDDINNPSGLLNILNLDSNFNTIVSDLSQALFDDICVSNRPNTNFENTNIAIQNLENFYYNTIDNLNSLSNDISSITLLTQYDTYYLKRLEEQIINERKKLKNLFGVDGANNGKFLDTKYMKNLKLNEIIIISLLLIFLIFIYSKKK